jgi:hypothetical protein
MATVQGAAHSDFHASIREAEAGVFRAEYRGELNPDHPDEWEFSDYHIGISVADVKLWTEQMARMMGYALVAGDAPPR